MYISIRALHAAAADLLRQHPDCEKRIVRGLVLAVTGEVADLSDVPSDCAVVTRVNGHIVVYDPASPWAHGLTCTCPDAHYGAGYRFGKEFRNNEGYVEYMRFCKHIWSVIIVADARQLEPVPAVALRLVA